MSLELLASELIELTPKFLLLIRQQAKKRVTSTLTMPQFRILCQLKRGASSNSELADRCGLDITSMSRMADHLVKRGSVIRSVNTKDKRYVKLRLSAKGRREQDAVISSLKIWVSSNLATMQETDHEQLFQGLKVLKKLEDIMQKSMD